MGIITPYYYYISTLLGTIIAISSCILVIKNNRTRMANQTFFALGISAAIWSIGFFFFMLCKNKMLANFWSIFADSGASLAPAFYTDFIISLLEARTRYKKEIRICYILSLSMFFVNLTPWRAKDLIPKGPFNFYPEPNLFYVLFSTNFFFWVIYSLLKLFPYLTREKGIKAVQLKYVFWASILGFGGSSTAFLLTFNIPIPPFGLILFALYPVVIAYAILRYRLLDIEVIIRETVVFAGIFGFSVGMFVLAMMAGQHWLEPYLGGRQWLVPAAALLIVTFAVKPIERLVYNTIGKVLFKKRYAYQKVLRDAANGMATIRDPQRLFNLITHIVSMKMKLENVSILVYDERNKEYQLKASRGGKRQQPSQTAISENEPLVEWLREEKGIILLEDVQKWIGDEKSRNAKNVLTSELMRIEAAIDALGASVCVPSFYKDNLLGILVLGDKKSGGFFSQDDLSLFNALADGAAIAIKNSQLYFEIDERAKEIETLYQKEHDLFIHASMAFAAAVDARDSYTHGHSERVTIYSLAIADYLGPASKIESPHIFYQRLQIACVLHDVGKIGITDDILHKPTALSPKEWQEMQKHPVIGVEIISRIKGLHDIIGAIRHHHERYDGKGYPDGLKSEGIPFMARIIAVADTYDAITSDRPYRKALSPEAAKEEIKRNGSAQFDPFMVAAFLKAFEEGKIKWQHNKRSKQG